MTDHHSGRLLAACLHQAIAELLPLRLEYYEEGWLNPKGLRDGTIGLAPISAVFAFLRAEDGAYDRVVARAGVLAADWSVASITGLRRRTIGWLPRPLRTRSALRLAAQIMRGTHGLSRASARTARGLARVEIDGSVFCAVRHSQPVPLCGFFVALAVRTLETFGIAATGTIERCRAVGGSNCVVTLDLAGSDALSSAKAA